MLQDIHCKPEMVKYWEIEWGCRGIYAPFRGDSRGTVILFNNNFEYKIHRQKLIQVVTMWL